MGRALGELEVTLLYALMALGDDAPGLALRQEVRVRSGRDLSPGAVYTALGRMEDRGLIESVLAEGGDSRSGRPIRLYTLLAAGTEALTEAHRHIRAMSHGLGDALTADPGRQGV